MEHEILDAKLIQENRLLIKNSREIGIAWFLLGLFKMYIGLDILYLYSSSVMFVFVIPISDVWESLISSLICFFICKAILKNQQDLAERLIIFLGITIIFFFTNGIEIEFLEGNRFDSVLTIILIALSLNSYDTKIQYSKILSKKGIYLSIIILYTFSLVLAFFLNYETFKLLR